MKNHKLLMAGPCSAESAEQMKQIARMISLINDNAVLRAGCWKPRTSPGGFEGYGVKALEWIREAAEESGLKWITEAGTAQHAEAILQAKGDQLWIGARTTGDPFAVEEIARVLEGTPCVVWVKNPVGPDVRLWSGAVERLKKRNVAVAGIIHRGFTVWPKSDFRNAPCWEVEDMMRREHPELLCITDVSHMAGNTKLIPQLSLTSAQRDSDGLMVEVHPCPDAALTDKEQQLTPLQLLKVWEEYGSTGTHALQTYRSEIDEIDEALWKLIAKRQSVVAGIGQWKEVNGKQVIDHKRRAERIQRFADAALFAGLTREQGRKLFDWLHECSVEEQKSERRKSEKVQ